MLIVFYADAVVLIAVGAHGSPRRAGMPCVVGLVVFATHLAWQIVRLDIPDPALCLALFKSDRDAGLLLFAGMLLDAYFAPA